MSSADAVSISQAVKQLADSITPVSASSIDATGGNIGCLTEAAMGITAGLVKVADAINHLAEAIENRE